MLQKIFMDIDIGTYIRGMCGITQSVGQFLEFNKLGFGHSLFSSKSRVKGRKIYLPH